MTEKTKNQSVWCDNNHEPIQMIYSHETMLENGSIYICSLCHAEKTIKESPWNGQISIEWNKKPNYTNISKKNHW